jgi:hypothetical protein
MKKQLLIVSMIAGLAAYAYGQGDLGSAGSLSELTPNQYGTFSLDNLQNGSTSETATSGGLVWIGNTFATADLLGNNALAQDLNIAVFDGSSLVVELLVSDTTAGGDSSFGGGQFLDNSTATYFDTASVGGATRSLTLDMWTGDYATYALAVASGLPTVYTATATFSQPLGNAGSPATTPTEFQNMPAMVLLPPVPEPTAIALATLGGLSLLGLRRRKAA